MNTEGTIATFEQPDFLCVGAFCWGRAKTARDAGDVRLVWKGNAKAKLNAIPELLIDQIEE